MPQQPTEAQTERARRVTTHEARDPLTDRRLCRWCGVEAPEEAQAGGEYRCPDNGCGRWQQEKAWPDGIPGLTQVPEACRHCGATSEWAPGEEDGVKRCPACRCDMHPRAAMALCGQAIVPGPRHEARAGAADLRHTRPALFAERFTTVTDPSAFAEEADRGA